MIDSYDVVVARRAGAISMTFGGFPAMLVNFIPSAANLGAMPPVTTADPCIGVDGTTPLNGTFCNLCVRPLSCAPGYALNLASTACIATP